MACAGYVHLSIPVQVIALITDLDTSNTSASVTNSIEVICRSLTERLIVPAGSVFIEHYEPISFHNHTFDIVTIAKGKDTLWENRDIETKKKLLLCNDDEFDQLTLENKTLTAEIEKIRSSINPHLDLPEQVESDYLIRQFEIEDNMISKEYLSGLICKGATERELLNVLKRDLSIFAEVYANPSDSYMCFSEFPLDGGVVDFVILTGVSRMDIFLIEIKGADFNILNRGSYQKFNANIDRATGQIRDRLGYIHRNREAFRNKIHAIGEQVLSGTSLYNAFTGPYKTVLVDKNKDINIHNVVIGGRTADDIKESFKRQDFEQNFTLPIKLESWDTFLRKLRRN